MAWWILAESRRRPLLTRRWSFWSSSSKRPYFGHRGAVWSIAGKDFMGFGEAFRIEHQSDHDLLAVRASSFCKNKAYVTPNFAIGVTHQLPVQQRHRRCPNQLLIII